MYADREEAKLEQRRSSGNNGARAYGEQRSRKDYSPASDESSVARSPSASLSPRPAQRSQQGNLGGNLSSGGEGDKPGRGASTEERERELQEKLRRRAMMSKGRKRSDSSPRLRSPSRESFDRRRSEQRRERRRGVDVMPDRRDDNVYPREGERHRATLSRSRSHSRSRSRSRSQRRLEGGGSKRGSSRRLSPDDDDDDEYSRRRRRVDRSEDRYDDPHAYRRDPRYDGYHDGYYDRTGARGYYPPGPPRRGYPNRYGGPGPRDAYYDAPHYPPRSRYTRSPSPPPRRRRGESKAKSPNPGDYELRSIFCSQLAARLGQRDLGEFFEDKLGEGTVRDVRIISDKNTGRSKGIGYVELKDEALVEQAIGFSGTTLFGIPLLVQRTEAARNRGQGASSAETPIRPNIQSLSMDQLASLPQINGQPIHIDPGNLSGADPSSRLYVGSLHFSLTDEDIKAVFEPFGAILSVDLHREPGTQKSKGFAFVHFANTTDAEKAIQHMNGFDLAGRQIKVGHVASRVGGGAATSSGTAGAMAYDTSGAGATMTSSFDEGGGGGLNASSRAALMEKLARVDHSSVLAVPSEQQRPSSIPQAVSKAVLLKNMFNPEEETERGWDKELADDVKDECEAKYGKVAAIKVDTDSAGEIWIKFDDTDGAKKAINGLNGRFFGGRSISASFVSEGIINSMLS